MEAQATENHPDGMVWSVNALKMQFSWYVLYITFKSFEKSLTTAITDVNNG
jgi:hypothetical protein